MSFQDEVGRMGGGRLTSSPLGDDGLGDVLGAVVSFLHQPSDLLRTEVKGQPAHLRSSRDKHSRAANQKHVFQPER